MSSWLHTEYNNCDVCSYPCPWLLVWLLSSSSGLPCLAKLLCPQEWQKPERELCHPEWEIGCKMDHSVLWSPLPWTRKTTKYSQTRLFMKKKKKKKDNSKVPCGVCVALQEILNGPCFVLMPTLTLMHTGETKHIPVNGNAPNKLKVDLFVSF